MIYLINPDDKKTDSKYLRKVERLESYKGWEIACND